jgi:hypothetical protein
MLRLIFQYYKELLLLNIGISICLGLLISLELKAYGFPISFMTGGFVLSIAYYEISKQKQYYFYYNKGLSKIHLYLSSFMINTIIGVLLIFVIKICRIC